METKFQTRNMEVLGKDVKIGDMVFGFGRVTDVQRVDDEGRGDAPYRLVFAAGPKRTIGSKETVKVSRGETVEVPDLVETLTESIEAAKDKAEAEPEKPAKKAASRGRSTKKAAAKKADQEPASK
jgi:hypothetical protein